MQDHKLTRSLSFVVEDFNHTINNWIKELDQYNSIQLCAKPSPNDWSVGQMILHLINDTNYYIGEIKICLSTNNNASEKALPEANIMFRNNAFPDAVIEGAPANACIPQPDSKEQLMGLLLSLKDEVTNIEEAISKSSFTGKTNHPGLGYFSAAEWLQFSEMHFRHHLRQKKRIDDFLKIHRY